MVCDQRTVENARSIIPQPWDKAGRPRCSEVGVPLSRDEPKQPNWKAAIRPGGPGKDGLPFDSNFSRAEPGTNQETADGAAMKALSDRYGTAGPSPGVVGQGVPPPN
jgi:hypothetical protein